MDEFVELDEEGIPGHGSHHSWAKRIHSVLRELGIPFEAEAEATRFHLGDLVVEITEAEKGYQVSLSIPLPGGDEGEDPDYYASIVRWAARLLSLLGKPVEYSLDTSLPDYPTLYAFRRYDSPEELAEGVERALRKIVGETQGGHVD